MAIPIVFVPIELIPTRLPIIIAPSIPIVRRMAVWGASPVPTHPIRGSTDGWGPPAARTAGSHVMVIISPVIAVIRTRKGDCSFQAASCHSRYAGLGGSFACSRLCLSTSLTSLYRFRRMGTCLAPSGGSFRAGPV